MRDIMRHNIINGILSMKLNLSNNFYKQENNVISERTDLKKKTIIFTMHNSE